MGSKKSKSGAGTSTGSDRGQTHGSRAGDRGSGSSSSVGVANMGRDGANIGDRSGGIAGVITEHGAGRHHDKVCFMILIFKNKLAYAFNYIGKEFQKCLLIFRHMCGKH